MDMQIASIQIKNMIERLFTLRLFFILICKLNILQRK